MDQDKPFKTIEVVDNRTNQLCKIACMSCIRGHRTTSCGIPVCRQKVFWTVKRPGRPSNSCTCRYGSTGGCKCVTAMSKCPHKNKKGEKRSTECRCDEQGRYCCLLEPEHWETLMNMSKPVVTFFSNREALEARQAAQTPMHTPATPSYFSPSTPQRSGSCCGTPGPQPVHKVSSPYETMMTPQSMLTPRFGFMGIGGPMGSPDSRPPDVLSWNGDAPIAPRERVPQQTLQQVPPVTTSCCGSSATPSQPIPPPVSESCCASTTTRFYPQSSEVDTGSCCQPATSDDIDEEMGDSCCQKSTFDLPNSQDYAIDDPFDHTGSLDTFGPSGSQPSFDDVYMPPAFDFDRWNQNYQAYQYPGAICQKCGLNGCTCRNCPPVMQNYGTTSWAQGCGRAHARMTQRPAPVHQQPRIQQHTPQAHHTPAHLQTPIFSHQGKLPQFSHPAQPSLATFDYASPPHTYPAQSPLPAFDYAPPPDTHPPDGGMDFQLLSSPPPEHLNSLDHNFIMPDGSDPVSFSDFLMSELDRPSHTPGEDILGS